MLIWLKTKQIYLELHVVQASPGHGTPLPAPTGPAVPWHTAGV